MDSELITELVIAKDKLDAIRKEIAVSKIAVSMILLKTKSDDIDAFSGMYSVYLKLSRMFFPDDINEFDEAAMKILRD